MTIESRVVCVIAKKLRLVPEEIDRSAAIVNDLGADSLDAVEIVIDLEDEFHLRIPDEHADSMHSVRDVCDYVERALADDTRSSIAKRSTRCSMQLG